MIVNKGSIWNQNLIVQDTPCGECQLFDEEEGAARSGHRQLAVSVVPHTGRYEKHS